MFLFLVITKKTLWCDVLILSYRTFGRKRKWEASNFDTRCFFSALSGRLGHCASACTPNVFFSKIGRWRMIFARHCVCIFAGIVSMSHLNNINLWLPYPFRVIVRCYAVFSLSSSRLRDLEASTSSVLWQLDTKTRRIILSFCGGF